MDILCRVPTAQQTYKTVLLQTETQEDDSREPMGLRQTVWRNGTSCCTIDTCFDT